jgi:long-chain acyl-CoA synthetase
MFDAKHEALLRRAGPNLRTIELGSAFLSASDKRRLLELFPNARICMHYGLTEASRSTFLEFRSEAAKLDTVGRPSPNVTIQICDPDGRALPPGEHGEIFVSGGHVTAGYWNDVERTRAHLTADRAFRTGDHGYFDADGYVCLLGRKDELINCGGVKISPLELEAKIAEARPTLEFCVVGIPDPAGIAGEVPVVAVAGAPQPTLTLAALTAELAQKVEKNKLPREVIFIDRIPRTENGKPIRRELRALLSNAAPAERSS